MVLSIFLLRGTRDMTHLPCSNMCSCMTNADYEASTATCCKKTICMHSAANLAPKFTLGAYHAVPLVFTLEPTLVFLRTN